MRLNPAAQCSTWEDRRNWLTKNHAAETGLPAELSAVLEANLRAWDNVQAPAAGMK